MLHRRQITPAQFDELLDEIGAPRRPPCDFDLFTYRHENLGEVIMLRSHALCVALVEAPECLDAMLGARAGAPMTADAVMVANDVAPASPDGAVLAWAMRAGKAR